MGKSERNREIDFQIQVWMKASACRMLFCHKHPAFGEREKQPSEGMYLETRGWSDTTGQPQAQSCESLFADNF